jgi:hypothetical protein
MSETNETLTTKVQLLELQVKALEARLNELCPPPNLSKVAPDGIQFSFDVKKWIENIESRLDESDKGTHNLAKGTYYENWAASDYSEIVIGDQFISKQHGDAMFDGFYHVIGKMTSLKKMKMISHNGNPLGSGISILPDIRKLKNSFVSEMHICAGFEFIPYLENFPSLRQLEIVNHPFRTHLNNDLEKKSKIREYCEKYDIQLLCN